MKTLNSLIFTACSGLLFISPASAVEVITFDETINGITSFSFDGNNDGLADVIFSTQDPSGFFTSGPGPNMSYIQEPGLEGTTQIPGEDLRVDFLGGATGNLQFGFAVSEDVGAGIEGEGGIILDGEITSLAIDSLDLITPYSGVTFSVFDANDNLLNSAFQNSFLTETEFGVSDFPEAILSLNFPGVASYGIFDFEEGPGRYIIDNFTGTFDAAENNVAPPGSLPETALLPDNTGEPFFNFNVVIGEDGLGIEFPIFIDPDVATAYEYKVGPGGPLVASVIIPNVLPNGDGGFLLNLCGETTTYSVNAGAAFDLTSISGSGGVGCFVISGIDTAEMLDPTDPLAFVTGLTFVSSGAANITQTPITTFVDPSPTQVSEPATLALMLSSLFGLGFINRRRSKS